MTLIFSADRFIVNGVVFVVFCSVAVISILTANEYLFFLIVALATATVLPFFAKISIMDIIKILLITLISSFWLTIEEFVDGFAYSHIWVAIGVVIASALLFSPDNRQFCALIATLLSYSLVYAVGANADLQSIVLAIAIAWTATYRPINKESLTALN
ncbi:MAG: hypothetical protein K2J13_04990 [Clostridia bacterium]|nr:hypothetical protein [Clostridia bacterium]